MSDGGKGSAPRPYSVSAEDFSSRWDAIFKRPAPQEPSQPPAAEPPQAEPPDGQPV